MELNEIKKILYKGDIEAKFLIANRAGLEYSATLFSKDSLTKVIYFIIPFSDIKEARFFPSMEARYLIRYIKTVIADGEVIYGGNVERSNPDS